CPIRFCQQSKKVYSHVLCSRGPVGSHAFLDLRNPLFFLPLFCQCPASVYSSPRHPERKPSFRRERNGCLCLLLGQLPFLTELMKPSSNVQDRTQAIGVRQLLGQGERRVTSLESLRWITEQPPDQGRMR